MPSERLTKVLADLDDVDRRTIKIFEWLCETLGTKVFHYDISERRELALDESVFLTARICELKAEAERLEQDQVNLKLKDVLHRFDRAKLCMETLCQIGELRTYLHSNGGNPVVLDFDFPTLFAQLHEAESANESRLLQAVINQASSLMALWKLRLAEEYSNLFSFSMVDHVEHLQVGLKMVANEDIFTMKRLGFLEEFVHDTLRQLATDYIEPLLRECKPLNVAKGSGTVYTFGLRFATKYELVKILPVAFSALSSTITAFASTVQPHQVLAKLILPNLFDLIHNLWLTNMAKRCAALPTEAKVKLSKYLGEFSTALERCGMLTDDRKALLQLWIPEQNPEDVSHSKNINELDKLKAFLAQPITRLYSNTEVFSRDDLALLADVRRDNKMKNEVVEPVYMISDHAYFTYAYLNRTMKSTSPQRKEPLIKTALDIFIGLCDPPMIDLNNVFRFSNDYLFLAEAILIFSVKDNEYKNSAPQYLRMTQLRGELLRKEMTFLATEYLALSPKALQDYLNGGGDEFAEVTSRLKTLQVRMIKTIRRKDVAPFSALLFMKIMNNFFDVLLNSEYDLEGHEAFVITLIKRMEKEVKAVLTLDSESQLVQWINKKLAVFVEMCLGEREELVARWFSKAGDKDMKKIVKEEEFYTFMEKRFGPLNLRSAPSTPRPIN